MKRSITITPGPIDEPVLVATRAMNAGMGAALYFTGVVRGTEGSDAIAGLDYEAFEPMAHHQFSLILDDIERRWPIESVRLVHRIGPVRANEASLWVEVISPHRGEAFAACQHLIDEMKRVVPIWKRPLP